MEITNCVIQEAKSAKAVASATIELDNAITISNLQLTRSNEGGLNLVFPIGVDDKGVAKSFIECKDEKLLAKICEAVSGEYEKHLNANKLEEITLTVAGCSEFHSMAPYYDGIKSTEEAVAIYIGQKADNASYIPAIGIEYGNSQMDFVMGDNIDYDYIMEFMPELQENAKALDEFHTVCEELSNTYAYNIDSENYKPFGKVR